VFEAVERETMDRIAASVAAEQPADALGALRIGAQAWLETCSDPEVHRIVLLEGPAVLGWSRWREIGMRYGLDLVTGVLEHALATGEISQQPIDLLAHMLLGAIDEAALYVAQAPDPARARARASAVVERFIVSLRGQ
jgi:hypothetical protein